jgi:hypothetical protein
VPVKYSITWYTPAVHKATENIKKIGSGIRDQGSGIRDQGSGIRDQGSDVKFKDQGFGDGGSDSSLCVATSLLPHFQFSHTFILGKR